MDTDWKGYLLASEPSEGPHEHDTINGYVYRILVVLDEEHKYTPRVQIGGFLKDTFKGKEIRNEDGTKVHARWSWGKCGVVARTVGEAEDLMKEVLGSRYGGRVG